MLPRPMPAPEAHTIVRYAHGIVTVIAEDPDAVQHGLDRAVEQIRAAAGRGDQRGILITRRSRSLFTVEATPDVPYGLTMEKDRWYRPAPPSAAASSNGKDL
ncbi:hypothetical protein ACS5PJ_17555 [Pseudarthrobacter sp. YS3]|uniref:hypothetical protein n=1 Tax=Pseudarthrobacter sp. YS3 TaxID=3453718 RepID=UPI003EEBDAA6